MPKLDPKVVKKINQSKLILAAEDIGMKNPNKVSKESLITAFVKAFEKKIEPMTEEEQEAFAKDHSEAVNVYNSIIKDMGLAPETTDAALDQSAENPPTNKGKGKGKTEKPKKEKNVKEKGVRSESSRIGIICSIIKSRKNWTKKEIEDKAEKTYTEKGGSASMRHTKWLTGMVLQTLTEMGILEKDGKNYTTKK